MFLLEVYFSLSSGNIRLLDSLKSEDTQDYSIQDHLMQQLSVKLGCITIDYYMAACNYNLEMTLFGITYIIIGVGQGVSSSWGIHS